MEKFVPVRDAAKQLSCSPETLLRQLRTHKIPGMKIGKDWRVSQQAIVLALGNKR